MAIKNTPPAVSLNLARKLMSQGKPWRFRIINTNGTSNKFWECIGTGKFDDVHIQHGRRGSTGQGLTKNWPYVEDKVPKKLKKGYRLDIVVDEEGYDLWHAKTFLPVLDFPYSLITSYKSIGEDFECYDAEGALIVTVPPIGVKQLRLEDRPTITFEGS